MDLEITFPGGKRVDAQVGDLHIPTDQSVDEGGQGSAPDPFTLFLSSIGTCSGIYALGFCQARDISAEGLRISMSCPWNEKTKRLDNITLTVTLPEGFPEKYRTAILRAMEQCTVKKHISEPPEFILQVAD